MPLNCVVCGSDLGKKQQTAKYCSAKCRGTYQYGLFKAANVYLDISPGTRGAISELIAVADLMVKGCTVFRAMSPDSECDLVAIKDGRVLRVEVETGYITHAGTLQYPRKFGQKKRKTRQKYDVLIVVRNSECSYVPSLEEALCRKA